MKSERNKTINTSIEEGKSYLNKCITLSEGSEKKNFINKTVIGNMEDVCDKIEKESIDLIIADPPYNLTKQFGNNKFSKMKDSEYKEYTYNWLSCIYPLLKPNGSIYVCCDWKSSTIIHTILQDFFHIQNRITWQREKGRGSQKNWKNSMEDIWFATKSKDYTFNIENVKIRKRVIAPYKVDNKPKDWVESKNGNFRDTCPSNFWDDITIPFWSMPENAAHPTQKPEKLIAKLILASSNENDIILDPFLGSGTTSVVAKKLNRRYIGIEKEPQYAIWAEQRLEMADSNTSIQGYENGIFFERNYNNSPKKE